MKIKLFILFLICGWNLSAQPFRILLDDNFSDWQDVPVLHTDPAGDGNFLTPDFERLWVANDENFIFIRFEILYEINIQSDNNIEIYIDSDNNINTGQNINGIGADFRYDFSDRDGFAFSEYVRHEDVGLVTSPTVSSTQFEIAFERNKIINGQPLFGNTIKILLKDGSADMQPDAGETITYTMASGSPPDPLPFYSIPKQNPDHLRILSYNVQFDGFFESNKIPSFTRILQATDPDIIAFQEIYDHSSWQTKNQVEDMLPSEPGEEWYHVKIDPDIIMVSRFPLLNGIAIGGFGNGAFKIDLKEKYNTELLLLNAHTPCCGNNSGRQEEVDAMMSLVRNIKNGGFIPLPEGAPIILCGDMNFVGFARQLETLVTGDILNNSIYGDDFAPDWDGQPFVDGRAFATNRPMAFTWYDTGSSFSPGRLDFMVYSGSVLETQNSFSLFTPALPTDTLSKYNLFTGDATFASDHLPVVFDFKIDSFPEITPINNNYKNKTILNQNFPNPFTDKTNITFSLENADEARLEILNKNGEIIKILENKYFNTKLHHIEFYGKDLPAGIYFYRLITKEKTLNRKFIKI